MEAVEFAKTVRRICSTHVGCAECELNQVHGRCDIRSICADHVAIVSAVEQWEKEHPEEAERERQKAEHPEESSDLHAIIDALEDRIDKLDKKVSNEALIFREVSKRNRDAHIHLSDRIDALEKYHVESMNEPKRTNKDVLLAAFPDALMDDNGIPYSCPNRLDAHYNCDMFENCLRCRQTHWLAEV